MNSPAYRVRRATVDDFNALKALWASMNFPVAELEKRLTEFQIAEDGNGQIVGAIGFQFNQRQGLIHNEAFTDFSVADQLRHLLWSRIQSLALNHGVARLWTRENAPFWTHNGLQPAEGNVLERLPEAWNRRATDWLTLRLKDETVIASLDREFDMFVASEKSRSEQALGQARMLKAGVTVLVLILCALLLAWGIYIYLHRVPTGP